MKEIKKATVMGLPVRILYVEQGDYQYGSSIEKQGLIEIEPDLNPELETKTLIHELIHLYGAAMGKDIPENTVLMFENIIWMMMVENKNVLQRLCDLLLTRKR